MRRILVPAVISGLLAAACGDDTGTGGAGGTGGSGGSTTTGQTTTTGMMTTSSSTTTTTTTTTSTGMEVCGDGAVGANEECDDGNGSAGDGCDADCAVEAGYVCDGNPSVCVTDCGDGIVVGAEECDDANDVSGDGCDMTCVVESGYTCDGMPSTCTADCGDGVIAAGAEECDDQNTDSSDGCSDTCAIETGWSCMGEPSNCMTSCGDGIVSGTETCDDGNNTDADGCSAACATETGYQCTGSPSTCTTTCGDDIVAGTETCDDNNTNNGDCCSSTCAVEAGCETEPNNSEATADDFAAHQVAGTVCGFVDPAGDANYYFVTLAGPGSITAETLDGVLGTTCISQAVDSRIRIFDAASMQIVSDDDAGAGYCSLATTGLLMAGTYYVVVDASPLDPSLTFDYCLDVTVDAAVCGDGDLDPGETCDDGNLTPGDGCDATCQVECNGEVEPNDTSATATALLVPGNNNCAAITPIADVDFFSFTIPTVSDVRIETFDATGAGCVAGTDTLIELRGPNGTTVLGSDDDDGVNACSLINPAVDTGARALPPGTYYVRAIEFNNDATIAAYRVQVTFPAVCGNATVEGSEECDGGANCNADCTRVPVCGDTFIDAPEACDDGNTTNGDGCSSTCQIEITCIAGPTFTESEPNDDGTTATATNDFSSTNADGYACGDLVVTAAISPAGDDDVYAVTNPTASPIVITAETFSDAAGTACVTTDTDIRIRDAAGTQLAFSADEGLGACSHVSYVLAPGQVVYVHVIENGDNAALASYFLHVSFVTPLLLASESEPNDDGMTQTGASGIAGNDFSSANADGPFTGSTLITAALSPAGDEDVYAVTNSGAVAVTIDVETFGTGAVGTCSIDTGVHIKDAAGTVIETDDDDGLSNCSYIDNRTLAPGQTVYVHVTDFLDDSVVSPYSLLITFN
jgi:cysteine-rich repeat protein